MSATVPLLVLGTRPFSVEIADVAGDVPGFAVAGFVENLDPERCREPIEGLPVHWVDDVAALAGTHRAICGLGTTLRRGFVEQVAALGLRFATIVHPAARVSRRARLGEGTVVSAGAVIAAGAELGEHVIVNRGALVGHHTTVGDYVTLGPGTNVAGSCRVGASAWLGMGVLVLDGMTIGGGAVLGAGAVVTRDVPERAQALGVPARVTRRDVDPR